MSDGERAVLTYHESFFDGIDCPSCGYEPLKERASKCPQCGDIIIYSDDRVTAIEALTEALDRAFHEGSPKAPNSFPKRLFSRRIATEASRMMLEYLKPRGWNLVSIKPVRGASVAKFVAYDWFRVRARGWAASVDCDRERPRDEPGLVGEIVTIDGEQFRCVGVQRTMPSFPIQPGEKIGLLVEEL